MDERDRRLAEHGAEAPLQRALAGADRAGGAGERERLGEVAAIRPRSAARH